MTKPEFKRWYDRDPRMAKIMQSLSLLSIKEQNEFAKTLNSIIKSHSEPSHHTLGVGADKIMILYKASNNRRWYDANPVLSYQLNRLSLEPDFTFIQIVNDLAKIYKDMLD